MGQGMTTWKRVGLKQKMIAMGLGLVIVPTIVIGGVSLHQFRNFSRASVTGCFPRAEPRKDKARVINETTRALGGLSGPSRPSAGSSFKSLTPTCPWPTIFWKRPGGSNRKGSPLNGRPGTP